MRRYLQIIVQENVINQLCHPHANPSTVILAKDYMMFVYECHTYICYLGLYFQCQATILKHFILKHINKKEIFAKDPTDDRRIV